MGFVLEKGRTQATAAHEVEGEAAGGDNDEAFSARRQGHAFGLHCVDSLGAAEQVRASMQA